MIKILKKEFLILIILCFFLTACGLTNRKDLSVNDKTKSKIVNISDNAVKRIGIKVEPAKIKTVNFYLKYNGIVKTIPSKSFYVSSPVKGKVLEVFVDQNQPIKTGQRLAVVSSQDIAELQLAVAEKQIDLKGDIEQAKLELSLAESNFNIEKELFENRITPKRNLLEAENKYKRAVNYLEVLEKKQESFNALSAKRLAILGAMADETNGKSGYVNIVTQHDGIILKRLINPGEIVTENTTLLQASDLSEVFLESNVYEKDIAEVQLGEKITFYPEAFPETAFEGEVNFIAQSADPDTRTISVRAKINNHTGKLKPEMFGKMFIGLSPKEILAINKKAVQKVDDKSVVYIKVSNGFKEIEVETGKESDGLIEIVRGLEPNQKVVTEGSFWLKSKLHSV